MKQLPRRRIVSYLILGGVVLVVGIWGLLSLGGLDGGSEAALVVDSSAAEPTTDTGLAKTTTTTQRIFVQVAGAVHKPGVYQVETSARVFQVLALAGGMTSEADPGALALAAEVSDGCRIYVPKKGEPEDPSAGAASPSAASVQPGATSAGSGTAGGSDGGTGGGKVSLNRGTVEQLDSLPGIGPSLAARIIAFREENGPFRSVDQLDDVPGIGPSTLERLRPLVCL